MDPQTSDQPQQPPVPTQPVQNAMAATPSMGRIVLISLGVLAAGLAIAYGGFYFGLQSGKKGPAMYPTTSPTVAVSPTSTASSTLTPAPSTQPQTTYTDNYFGYKISYPDGWIFRRTYGPDISKLAPTDVLSGFDIHYNILVNGQETTQATIVMNMLDAHGMTDIEKWIDQYDLNYPKQATRTSITFKGYATLKYTDETNPQRATEYLYFIAGKYAYRITYVEEGVIRNATRDIVNSFMP